jgi:hypothetical protein
VVVVAGPFAFMTRPDKAFGIMMAIAVALDATVILPSLCRRCPSGAERWMPARSSGSWRDGCRVGRRGEAAVR